MKVLITGGSGYFSWELIRQMKLRRKFEIVVASSDPAQLETDNNYMGIKIISNKDIWNNDDLMSSIDILIHTAFCRKSIGEQLISSLRFSQRLFYRVRVCGIAGVINLSSQSVYGSEKEKLPKEEAPFAPGSLYAFAKSVSEILIEMIIGESNSIYTNIRLSSMAGPSKNVPVNVLYKFVENALNEKNIIIQGGQQNFSFIDVRDAADAVIRLMDIPLTKWEQTYNLGPERQINIVDLAKIAVEYAVKNGKDPVQIYINEKDIQLNAGMNSEKLYKTINWRPKFSIEDTIKVTGNNIIQKK